MDFELDLRSMELLFSRMCHDLVGPVGAVVNGVELLEEFGGEMAQEALTLLGSSARVASRRLRVYRVAYGMAAGAAITSINDLATLVNDFLEGGKINFEITADSHPSLSRLGMKLLLNMVLCTAETLPRGGKVTLHLDSKSNVTLTSEGENARMPEGFAAALDHEINTGDLDPRTIQPYITAKISHAINANVKCAAAEGKITYTATLPAAG